MLAPALVRAKAGSAHAGKCETSATTGTLSPRRLSFLPSLVVCLFVFAFLPGKALAAVAAENTATLEVVNAALDKVQEAVQWKVNHDIDVTSQAFWIVYDVERARWWADILGAPLSIVEQTISAIGTAAALGKLGSSVTATQNGWLGAGTFALGIGQLEKAGADLQLALDGPAYASDVKQMYVRAQDASKGEGKQGFERVMREGALGSTLIRSPDLARERGLPSFVKDPSSIWSGIDALKGELSSPATAIPPSAAEKAVERLTELRTTLLMSDKDSVEVSVGGETVSLGAIGALDKLHGSLFLRFAEGLGDEMVKVGVDAVRSSGKALTLHLSFDGGIGPTDIQSSILTVDGLAWTAVKQSFRTDVRTTIAEVPQSMLFALSAELSNAWYLAETTLAEVRKELFANQEQQGEGGGVAKRTPIPVGDATCKTRFHEITLGGEACGIKLTTDRRVFAGGDVIPNVFSNDQDAPAEVLKVIVLPTSPSGRYTVVKPCSHECHQRLFVVDHSNGAIQSFDAAVYGPTNWIAWTDDEQYFVLQNHDDGVDWLKLVHLPDGRVDKLSAYDTDFAAMMNAEESFAWLGPRRFNIALMDACMEEPCQALEYPRDLTRVEFEIADGRLDVKSIEDPSKAPAALRDALQAHQTRIELKDGSVLIGEIQAAKVPFASSFGAVDVDLGEVQGFAEQAVRLADGSVLKGRFETGTISVVTGRGNLTVSAQDIVSIARGAVGAPTVAPVLTAQAGQGILTGRIVDNFKQPVRGAEVRIAGTQLAAQTVADGGYQIPYVPGNFAVRIERSGYDSLEFNLALTQASTYPVEDKVLLRLPPEQGVFYWDKQGWSRLGQCKLTQTSAIPNDGNIDFPGIQKEAYAVSGQPLSIGGSENLIFINNATAISKELMLYRVDARDEIITDTRRGGLNAMADMFSDGGSKKQTSQAKYARNPLYPGREFYLVPPAPGVYVFIDRSRSHACFKFQVGPDQPRAEHAVEDKPEKSRSLSVDGKAINFWPAASGSEKEVYFQMESKGYRNTYKLDCAGRRFLWSGNVDLSTGYPTGNAAGAEWKPLSSKSTTSNAVYDAICPELLSAKDQPLSATGRPTTERVPPVVPAVPEKTKGASTEEKKLNSSKVDNTGSTGKQGAASRPLKRPRRDTQSSGSRGYTDRQQRAVKEFNEM